MSYVEQSIAWFLRNTVIKGFSILLNSKFIFFTLTTLIWAIIAPISLVFHNFLGEIFVNGVLKMEIAIIFSLIISGLIINFIKSIKSRILLTIIILSIISILFLFVVPIDIQFYFPVIGSVLFAGTLGLSLFIIIRSFNTSWINRIMIFGKSPKKIFMHKIAIFINLVSIFAPIFLLIRYFQGLIIFDLILAIIGFATWSIIMYAIIYFPDFFSYDIFASILSAIYLIAVIFFFMYVGNPLFVIILDVIFLTFGISVMIQILYSRRKLEKVSVILPKSARSPEDSSIIIIQDDDNENNSKEIPLIGGSEYSIEQETTEVRSNFDGFIVSILGLILCFHFIILQLIGELLIPGFIIPLPFQFTIVEYHFFLVLFGYCLVIATYIAFKVSYRFRGYSTKTMSDSAAFLKFLSIVDEKERKHFLQRITKIASDILIGGIIDLIEGNRRRWEEGLQEGRKFLKRLLKLDEE